MQLELIISALRTRCPTFGNRVAGAAQFKLLPESAALAVPCAFVIPLDDNPKEPLALNSIRQVLNDSFSIIVAASNLADEKGQASAASIHALRTELWAALLGWNPTEDYAGITYDGGSIISIDRARIWYQFDFSALMEIGPDDGYQEDELALLPHFDGADISLDAIDPADPNLANPGPDGRIEVDFSAPADGNLP